MFEIIDYCVPLTFGNRPKPPGSFSNMIIKNVQVTNARQIGILINGFPWHLVDNLNLENIQIEMTGGGNAQNAPILLPENEAAYPDIGMFGNLMPACGLYLRHASRLTLTNVSMSTIKPEQRSVMKCLNVDGLTLDGFTAPLIEGIHLAVYDEVKHLVVKNSPTLEPLVQ